jgi:hypothetical protein
VPLTRKALLSSIGDVGLSRFAAVFQVGIAEEFRIG